MTSSTIVYNRLTMLSPASTLPWPPARNAAISLVLSSSLFLISETFAFPSSTPHSPTHHHSNRHLGHLKQHKIKVLLLHHSRPLATHIVSRSPCACSLLLAFTCIPAGRLRRSRKVSEVVLQALECPGSSLGIRLDDDAGVVCGETVPQDRLDKEADSLEVCKELVGFGKVDAGEFEQLGL